MVSTKALCFTSLAVASVLGTSLCGKRGHSQALAVRDTTGDTLTGTGTDTSSLTWIAIDVYIHAVANSSSSAANLSNQVIEEQMKVLNQDFTPAKISFTLRNTTWTVNQDWANGADGTYVAMMEKFHQGGNDVLNIYFVDRVARNGFQPPYSSSVETYAGLASDPWDATTTDPTSSNCVIAANTVPGDSGYLGRTATHEVGHWLGLYHPFEGGCEADPNKGDRVSDTPASLDGTFGCEIGRDSCPTLPGVDPIHNYMGYSDDACMKEFTPGQIVRMHAVWNKWRKPQSNSTTSSTPKPSPTSSGVQNPTKPSLVYTFAACAALLWIAHAK